jgi:hypothetical protein
VIPLSSYYDRWECVEDCSTEQLDGGIGSFLDMQVPDFCVADPVDVT